MPLCEPLMPFRPPTHETRYGIVRISKLAFDQAAAEGLNLFDRFLPLSVKIDAMRREIIVGGYHPSFDVIEEGSVIPEYTGTIVDGRLVPHWTRASTQP